jgi:hypothetical protein
LHMRDMISKKPMPSVLAKPARWALVLIYRGLVFLGNRLSNRFGNRKW